MDSFLICSAYKLKLKEAINDTKSKFIEKYFIIMIFKRYHNISFYTVTPLFSFFFTASHRLKLQSQ
jgi:hypothetical protein